jgi:hypothetical protein
LIERELGQLESQTKAVSGSVRLSEYVEKHYLPWTEANKAAVTANSYTKVWERYWKPSLPASLKFTELRTSDVTVILTQHAKNGLGPRTLSHLKWFGVRSLRTRDCLRYRPEEPCAGCEVVSQSAKGGEANRIFPGAGVGHAQGFGTPGSPSGCGSVPLLLRDLATSGGPGIDVGGLQRSGARGSPFCLAKPRRADQDGGLSRECAGDRTLARAARKAEGAIG